MSKCPTHTIHQEPLYHKLDTELRDLNSEGYGAFFSFPNTLVSVIALLFVSIINCKYR